MNNKKAKKLRKIAKEPIKKYNHTFRDVYKDLKIMYKRGDIKLN